MRNRHYTKPRSRNNPQEYMCGREFLDNGPPKATNAGRDLGQNATNVIQSLGHNPEPVGPNANKAARR